MAHVDYSPTADEQLDVLEVGTDPELYEAALVACELVFNDPVRARLHSAAITVGTGIVFRLPVVGHPTYNVFWRWQGRPRVEAVFAYP